MPSYPYISGQGALVQTLARLRTGFPPKVDAGYLQRFNIAPANESYVISILRFLGVIDEDGNAVSDKNGYFYGNDDAFRDGLEANLRSAYSQVFDEMGDGALDADKKDLAHWFRASDKSSDVVGQRQASTFQTLAALAGHGELPNTRTGGAAKKAAAAPAAAKKSPAKKAATKSAEALDSGGGSGGAGGGLQVKNSQDVGLTVRIEVNLPPGGDAETYDAIFASIKKHLMS